MAGKKIRRKIALKLNKSQNPFLLSIKKKRFWVWIQAEAWDVVTDLLTTTLYLSLSKGFLKKGALFKWQYSHRKEKRWMENFKVVVFSIYTFTL